MTQILIAASNAVLNTVTTTDYFSFGSGYLNKSATETNVQVTWQTPGTLSNYHINIPTNSTAASSSVHLRKNTANANEVLTIGSGTTGEFTDTTNTDTVSSSDKFASFVTSGGGGQFLVPVISGLFAPTTSGNTVNRFFSAGSSIDSSVNTVYYNVISGQVVITGASEAPVQFKNKTAATLQNLMLHISTNTASVAALKSRINGADGNLVVNVGSGTTGFFEDTTHSDSISSGDLINTSFDATVVSSIGITTTAVDYLTTSNATHYIGGINGTITNNTQAHSLTRYIPLSSYGNDQGVGEVYAKMEALAAFTASNLEFYVQTNTLTASSTLNFRKNAANGNQTITIGSGATGYFEDTTNTDSVAATDEINYQLITGTTGTSIVYNYLGILATYSSGGGNIYNETISDSLTGAYSNAPIATVHATISSSGTLSDSVTYSIVFKPGFTESLTSADIESIVSAIHAAITGSVTSTDMNGIIADIYVTSSDTGTSSDNLIGGLSTNNTTSDSGAVSDTATGGLLFNASTSDSDTSGDAIIYNLVFKPTITDTLVSADSEDIVADITVTNISTCTVSDSYTDINTFLAVVSDSVVSIGTMASVTALHLTIIDSIADTDGYVANIKLYSNTSDSIADIDSFISILQYTAYISDILTGIDAYEVAYNIIDILTESVVGADNYIAIIAQPYITPPSRIYSPERSISIFVNLLARNFKVDSVSNTFKHK